MREFLLHTLPTLVLFGATAVMSVAYDRQTAKLRDANTRISELEAELAHERSKRVVHIANTSLDMLMAPSMLDELKASFPKLEPSPLRLGKPRWRYDNFTET